MNLALGENYVANLHWRNDMVESNPTQEIYVRQQKEVRGKNEHEQSWVSNLGALQKINIYNPRKHLLDCKEWKTC